MAPPMMRIKPDQELPHRTSVVVIGGGIVGTSTALFLAEKGIPVVLCEKGQIGAEQSGRNWGWTRVMGRDVREIPLGRMGTKQDIAYACVFLVSEAAAFVSGDTLVVDGAAWIYRTPVAPRAAVGAMARQVEKSSRAVGLAKAKL